MFTIPSHHCVSSFYVQKLIVGKSLKISKKGTVFMSVFMSHVGLKLAMAQNCFSCDKVYMTNKCTVGIVTNRKVIRNSVPDFRNIKHA